MITDFHVKGYRGFADFELERLSRVNVILGKNNAGKTSLLEALYLNATGIDLNVVQSIAFRRGEFVYDSHYRDMPSVDLSHFFYGHKVKDGKQIELGTKGNHYELLVTDNPSAMDAQIFHPDRDGNDRIKDSRFLLKTTYCRGDNRKDLQDSYLAADGTVVALRRAFWGGGVNSNQKSLFIYPDALDNVFLSQLWNKVIVRNEERAIVDALRILEPRVNSVAFLLADQSPNRFVPRSLAGIVVGMDGESKRLPLGSLGDGMKRLLSIALALSSARDGALFIDEIDAGFHYSVMDALWKLIIKTATANRVQVFASTHSLDCIRGLHVVKEDGVLQDKDGVSLYTINTDFPCATHYGTDEIPGIVEHEIEVR